jgi:hypothetical protein
MAGNLPFSLGSETPVSGDCAEDGVQMCEPGKVGPLPSPGPGAGYSPGSGDSCDTSVKPPVPCCAPV